MVAVTHPRLYDFHAIGKHTNKKKREKKEKGISFSLLFQIAFANTCEKKG